MCTQASPLTYWLSSWAWDALLYACVVAATLGVFDFMGSAAFVGSAAKLKGTTLLLSLFGAATLPLSSAASFLFHKPTTALVAMSAFHFLSGFGLIVLNFILTFVPSTTELNHRLQNVYRLFPSYNLGVGLYTMSTYSVAQAARTRASPPPNSQAPCAGTPRRHPRCATLCCVMPGVRHLC